MSDQLYPLKLYLKYKPNLIGLAFAIVLNAISWIWIFLRIQPQDEPIFLHYNILFGVDFVGPWNQIYLLPIMALVILVVNFVIGWALFNKDKFISLIMTGATLVCQIFILVATALLIFLNA